MTTNLKLSLSLAALMFLSVGLCAQATFGIRAGVNIATQNYDTDGLDVSFDSKIGLDIAVLVELGITEQFAIQPELHYIQKGYKVDDFFGFGEEATFTVNYLDLPILGKLTFGESVKFNALLGPSFGFALSGKTEVGDESEDLDFDEDDGYQRFELGLVIGAGVSLPMGDVSSIFFDVRYILGVSNLYDDVDDEDIKATNRGLNIGIGYMF